MPGSDLEAEGLYLFCAAPPGTPLPGPDIAPFASTPVEALPLPPVSLWIQRLARPPERSSASVAIHHRVVVAAWKASASLAPMRFGQWFRDRDALVRALEPRLDGLAATLAHVAGAGEHAVRLSETVEAAHDAPPSSGGGTPGREHMERLAARERRKREREERGSALARELADAVGDLARDERVTTLDEGGLVSVAHLVTRGREGPYIDAVARFTDAHPALRVVRAGPWPPYSFVA